MVTVRVFGYLTAMLGAASFEFAPARVRSILLTLVERMPKELQHHLQEPGTGELRGFYLVLNERNLSLPDALELPLAAGDTLLLVSPVAGG